jgi:flagellar assembly factor FliW
MISETSSPARVTFNEGLPGFEAYREFQIVVAPESDPFAIVQGVGPGAPSFVAIDPRRVVTGYDMVLGPADRTRLADDGHQPLLWLAIVTLTDDGRATANLRAPLVINPASMRGIQVVTAESRYAIDQPLDAA